MLGGGVLTSERLQTLVRRLKKGALLPNSRDSVQREMASCHCVLSTGGRGGMHAYKKKQKQRVFYWQLDTHHDP